MGWGQSIALGQALSRAGSTFGPERLDTRRALEDDKRRAEAHTLAQDVGNQNLSEGQFRLSHAENLAPSQVTTATNEATRSGIDIQVSEKNLAQAEHDLKAAQAEFNATTDEQRGTIAKARVDEAVERVNVAREQIASSRSGRARDAASIRASDASVATSNWNLDQAQTAAERANVPARLAEGLIKDDIERYNQMAAGLFAASARPPEGSGSLARGPNLRSAHATLKASLEALGLAYKAALLEVEPDYQYNLTQLQEAVDAFTKRMAGRVPPTVPTVGATGNTAADRAARNAEVMRFLAAGPGGTPPPD